jgi:DNA-binding FadR family transcriptional regulator
VRPDTAAEIAPDPGLSVFDILAARQAIEGEVAFLAAGPSTPKHTSRLSRLIEVQAVAMAKDGAGHLHDRAFHLALAAMTGNEALVRVVDELWTHMFTPVFERLGRSSDGPRKTRSTLDDHRLIAAALAAGNGAAAREAMHTHIDHTRQWFLGEA